MKKSLILFFAIIAFGKVSLAQINEFNDKLVTPRFYAEAPSYEIDIKSKVSNSEIHWKPNIRTLTGIDVAIRDFLTLGIGWANNVGAGQAAIYGNSSYTDYRIALNLPWLHLETNYQSYQGLYVDNTSQINPSYSPDIKMQDPNFSAGNASINATFILDPQKFSFVAAIGQSARQESSGGSWLLGVALSDTFFNSPSGLIPVTVRSGFGDDQNIQNAKFYGLNVKGGYGYSFIFDKKWFISLAATLGGGGEYRQYTDGVNNYSSGGATTKIDFLASLGFNGDDFLAAIIATADDTEYTTQSLKIPTLIGDAKFAIGAHF